MSEARWMVERRLRDGDDRQTERGWEIRLEGGFVDLRDNYAESRHRILIGPEDVPLLIADLRAIVERGQ